MTKEYVKLEIFIPETHFPQLQKALQSVDAGHIGNYDSCLSYAPVMGTWRPLAGTHPYIGKQDEISCEAELKVEVTILAEKLMETVAAVKAVFLFTKWAAVIRIPAITARTRRSVRFLCSLSMSRL